MKYVVGKKSYLDMLLDIEETILTIDETIEKLEKYCTSLGRKQKFEVPIKQRYESHDSSYASWITGFIVGALVAIFKIALGVSQNESGNIINKSISFFGEFVWGTIIGAVIGIIFGLIVNSIVKSQKDQKLECIAIVEYEKEMKEYNAKLEKDQERVNAENKRKSYIYEQINILKKKRQSSVFISEKIYNYNIIPKKYWHDILALSYFIHYYNQPLTNLSVEDAKNSYKKASVDFENDLNRNLLVKTPKEIINASEYNLRRQRDLFRIVKNSYSSANTISKDIISESYNLNEKYDENVSCRYTKTNIEMEDCYLSNIQRFLEKGEE